MIFLTNGGALDAGQDAQIAQLAAALNGGKGKILLHLHGGLVDEKAGRETAERLAKAAAEGGFGLDEGWTQIYVVWRTGVFEVLRKNWLSLVENDELYNVLVRKLIEFAIRKLIPADATGRSGGVVSNISADEIRDRIRGRGDLRRPFADLETDLDPEVGARGAGPAAATQDDGSLALEFQSTLTTDREFNGAIADIESELNQSVTGRAQVRPGSQEAGAAAYARLNESVRVPIDAMRPDGTPGRAGPVSAAVFLIQHAGKIAFRCFKRFRASRDHGLHATVVEEVVRELYGDYLGAKVWGLMKKHAAAHFEGSGFGKALIDQLISSPPTRFVVSGHSAGSIWAAEMLKAMGSSGKQLPLELILLAPAVRYDLFAEALAAGGENVRSCRMFTMSDELERKDPVLGSTYGYIYPSSLLYLVAGAFEQRDGKAFVDAPLLGMRRFLGANWLEDPDQVRAAETIQAFFQKPHHDIVYSPSESGTMANSHGGFDDDKVTLASIARMCA